MSKPMMTNEELAAIERLALRATPGPWQFQVRRKGDPIAGTLIGSVAIGHVIFTKHEGGTCPAADGDFIAVARQAVPALIEEVRSLRAKLATMRPHAAKLNELAREFRETLDQ